MRLLWAALAVATVAGGVARATPAKDRAKAKKAAEVVVVAELLRGSSQPHCGIIAAVGEFEYRVVEVERGTLSEKRIVVWALCPEMSANPYHLSRLRLSKRKTFDYRATNPLAGAQGRRLYLIDQEVVDHDYVRYLGDEVAELDGRFTFTAARDGWRHYGIAMAAQVSDGRVRAIRLLSPTGFPRSFAWLGLPEVTWKNHRRRGGFSVGTFSASSKGVVGTAKGGAIELRRPEP